ncbi:MAG: hypothetical protein ACREFW_09495 [Rhizomicrobium sp.]
MRFSIALIALMTTFVATSVLGQEIPRIKARILAFDGKLLTVTAGAKGQTLTIGLAPGARLMVEEKASFLAIKPGDYLGATLAKSSGGWRALEVHLMPDLLKGVGEGFYPLPDDPKERIVTGPVVKNDLEKGVMTVGFRGSVGADGATCGGRAPRQGGCKGELTFALPANAMVVALKPGTKSALVPGRIAAISVIAGPDGHLVTPGLTIENEPAGENEPAP